MREPSICADHPRARLSRRGFLGGIGAAGAGAVLAGGCTAGSPAPAAAAAPRRVPFEGVHQAGVTLHPVPARSLVAAFVVQDADRAGLAALLRELTEEIRGLMAGLPVQSRGPAYPPLDSGILGDAPPADDLAIVLSVGASLFDDRFGLADRRPAELVEMPFLANDRLDPARSHGDVLLAIEAGHPDTVLFALRQLMRSTRRHLVLRWMVEGYTRGSETASAEGTPRNLLGFKDGTANPDMTDTALMDELVWVQPGAPGEPAWTASGSYHVVRIIRMFVEFWDRTPLAEQEAIMGRYKGSGAPLGRTGERDEPVFANGADDPLTPIDAHIRLANPRTPQSERNRILRRGFSFSDGFDGSGQLDQGLAFVSFQRSLREGFLTVQERLAGEPLEEYILPVGGGFFFALPGVPSPDRYLGDTMVGG